MRTAGWGTGGRGDMLITAACGPCGALSCPLRAALGDGAISITRTGRDGITRTGRDGCAGDTAWSPKPFFAMLAKAITAKYSAPTGGTTVRCDDELECTGNPPFLLVRSAEKSPIRAGPQIETGRRLCALLCALAGFLALPTTKT
jgi:hypothetical protein